MYIEASSFGLIVVVVIGCMDGSCLAVAVVGGWGCFPVVRGVGVCQAIRRSMYNSSN